MPQVPNGRGRDPTPVVRRDPAADRPAQTEAHPNMMNVQQLKLPSDETSVSVHNQNAVTPRRDGQSLRRSARPDAARPTPIWLYVKRDWGTINRTVASHWKFRVRLRPVEALMKRLVVHVALVVVLATPAWGQDYGTGLIAAMRGDYETALRQWAPLAEDGCAEAQYSFASLYENGWGVPLDTTQAAAWFRRAAEQGHAGAQLSLGDMYRDGIGVATDRAESIAWYRRAAGQGLPAPSSTWAPCTRTGLACRVTKWRPRRGIARPLGRGMSRPSLPWPGSTMPVVLSRGTWSPPTCGSPWPPMPATRAPARAWLALPNR